MSHKLSLVWWVTCALWLSAFGASAQQSDPLVAQGIAVGAGTSVENLTVFPLFASQETDLGEITTLDEALARGAAEVREVNGGEVNKLVVKNRGKRAIYVLAGTLVKGGKQDRQIGQDFVIEPNKSVAVDAFCVEQGRWESKREGATTGGKFVATKAIATSDVRRAAQYQQNQSEVWNKVSKLNGAHQKSAPSGTLMATVDAGDVDASKQKLARGIEGALASAPKEKALVGLAYALDGSVRSVRWFASSKVFGLFQKSLVEAAALDALTQRGERSSQPAASAVAAKASDVNRFVGEVESERSVQKRDTSASNANEYKESARGFGSKTRLKARPEVSVSSDYVAKDR
ncbi:MAG: hypothetical protein QM778_13945 [Myxococcales bacterium]